MSENELYHNYPVFYVTVSEQSENIKMTFDLIEQFRKKI